MTPRPDLERDQARRRRLADVRAKVALARGRILDTAVALDPTVAEELVDVAERELRARRTLGALEAKRAERPDLDDPPAPPARDHHGEETFAGEAAEGDALQRWQDYAAALDSYVDALEQGIMQLRDDLAGEGGTITAPPPATAAAPTTPAGKAPK